MKRKTIPKFMALLMVSMILPLCCCGSKEEVPVNGSFISVETSTSIFFDASKNLTEETIVFSDAWDYDESAYGPPNDDAKKYWEEFKTRKAEGASLDELISILSGVVVNDEQFVPGYIEYARHYILDFNETGDTSSTSNAMNTLTYGEAYTANPLFTELKESLGWNEIQRIIEQANEALKQSDIPTANELLNNQLPERYRDVLDAHQIEDAWNFFDDTYYYQVMGPTLGHQYIVHFNVDGTYERVKMNLDGLYDSGTWELSFLEDWNIRFGNVQFIGSNGNYYWNEYDSYYNVSEYTLIINTDGFAKEQFEMIVNGSISDTDDTSNTTTSNSSSVDNDLISILTSKKWQTDEGWYYQFYANGTGKMAMTDNSVSYGFEYYDHYEKENAITIMPSDMPYDTTWIYDPATGTFTEESYGYDVTTDSASVSYRNVNVYNE